jgi:hypothetical protein
LVFFSSLLQCSLIAELLSDSSQSSCASSVRLCCHATFVAVHWHGLEWDLGAKFKRPVRVFEFGAAAHASYHTLDRTASRRADLTDGGRADRFGVGQYRIDLGKLVSIETGAKAPHQ